MHPIRASDPTQVEQCATHILALHACHKEWKKWWGGCNDLRRALDTCLKAEKHSRRQRNLHTSPQYYERLEQAKRGKTTVTMVEADAASQ